MFVGGCRGCHNDAPRPFKFHVQTYTHVHTYTYTHIHTYSHTQSHTNKDIIFKLIFPLGNFERNTIYVMN